MYQVKPDTTKAIVANTIEAAIQVINIFNLGPEWAPRCWFDDGFGKRWKTIIVVPPIDGMKDKHIQWMSEVLHTKTFDLRIL